MARPVISSGNGDAGPTYALQIGIAQYNSGSFYGDGTITVDGSGTTLTTDTGIVVGAGGSGTLTISNGAAVSTGDTLGAALAKLTSAMSVKEPSPSPAPVRA